MKGALRQLRRRGGVKSELQRLGTVRGLLALADFAIQYIWLRIMLKTWAINMGQKYGLRQALLFPRYVDVWTRYHDVLRRLKADSSILEVGAGSVGLAAFAPANLAQLVSVDVDAEALLSMKTPCAVVCDATKLPFRHRTFDYVVCVDTLEHLPEALRAVAIDEFERASAEQVILSFPATSHSHIFRGETCDKLYQAFYSRLFGSLDLSTQEHLSNGHPVVEEMRLALKDAVIMGRTNCRVWLKYKKLSCLPLLGFFCGLAYTFFWRKRDHRPPYYSAVAIKRIR